MKDPAAASLYSESALRAFCSGVFRSFGVPQEDADLASDVLLLADLRGVDSHGVARMAAYFEMLDAGRINPTPSPSVVRETPSTATVDGDNGLGLVVGPWANAVAMEKARAVGSGWVSVCNTNHFGAACWYVLRALERDLVGWAMTNSTKIVAPHRGAVRMLGTNPIAIAFPGLEEAPIVIDMASCAAAYGKVEIAKRLGRPIPLGWAVDTEGRDTTDPLDVVERRGPLLPLGSDEEHSGHKGYCLAVMVDVLSAVLSGANWGPFTPPFTLAMEDPERSVGRGIGHFFGAMRIDGFIEPDAFKRSIDDYVRTMRSTPSRPGAGPVLVPGDPERAAHAERSRTGIPLVPAVVADLERVADRTGVDLPSPIGRS
ncbi:MAG: Ldh family oxidoreductase [Planctomycetota bacterium]